MALQRRFFGRYAPDQSIDLRPNGALMASGGSLLYKVVGRQLMMSGVFENIEFFLFKKKNVFFVFVSVWVKE